jgi:hypothetical protein
MLYMRRKYGHLHYFTYETAFATLEDCGYTIVDAVITDDYEIDDSMVPRRRLSKERAYYETRRAFHRHNSRRAASIFPHFNVLVPARE